ncbi:ankyrin repeat domain-containing protein [Alkalihalobacterium alkalinitrilicum]|uniref:ankyrin repeat domain-containing protein n=1 Tax=Alkalihalobacterium alkalinitrilicum TaxID=427920 RepID=UPI001C59B5D7|nr:ankyrin repeat domain-containing protein [Alkalihalobacterium alkalinitrilicum]
MKKVLKWFLIIFIILGLLGGYDQNKDRLVATLAPNKAWGLIQFLVKTGADPNSYNRGDFPALHYAVADGNLDMVHFLLDHNADVNLKTTYPRIDFVYQFAPLDLAIIEQPNNLPIFQALFAAGADPIALAPSISSMIQAEMYEVIELALAAGANPEPYMREAQWHQNPYVLELATTYAGVHAEPVSTTEINITDKHVENAGPSNPSIDLISIELGIHPESAIQIGDSVDRVTSVLGPLPDDVIYDVGQTAYIYGQHFYTITDDEPRYVTSMTLNLEMDQRFFTHEVIGYWGQPFREFEDIIDFQRNGNIIRFFFDPSTNEINKIIVWKLED